MQCILILILGWDLFLSSNKLLSQIAPTVLFSFTEAAHNWKQLLKIIAAEFNRTEVANELLDSYELRVQKMRKDLEINRLQLRASCLVVASGAIYLVAKETPVESVFNDIGLQRYSLEDASKEAYFPISEEKLPS
ncbi:MAG: ABC transporter substrate-binding protein, partial [Leptolyngbyaceae cyanobacterium CSU_1_3]|nr:ABC transporter substrate-binding protein [Leptolyngbyaceae cyanobacterium CSU_1_3]